MTQPRKEQIKDLKTKFTRVDQVGNDSLGGTVVQIIQNNIGDTAYDDLIAQSVTGAVGGADTAAPPVLYGGSGPFSGISIGQGFTITMPGVNAGNPVSIAVASTDLVVLGGSPVLTTSRAAAMINAALLLMSVTTPVAKNIGGQLVLFGANTSGPTSGVASFITLVDVTPGLLAILGFAGSPATAFGSDSPTRGIVTTSADGLGGYVALRGANQSEAVTSNPALLLYPTLAGPGYVPQTPPGQPIYGKLQQFNGAHILGEHFRLSFFRQGPVTAKLTTAKSNFTALGPADTLAINVVDSVLGLNESLSFSFSPAPNVVQDVLDIINGAWAAQTSTDTGFPATSAVAVCQNPGTYSFDASDSFFISFQTTGFIKITPGPAVLSTNDLVGFIQTAITTAGAALQGNAAVYFDSVEQVNKAFILSLNTNPGQSQVSIFPGGPGIVPGTYMGTLEKIGLSPGVYGGSGIAQLYGADEITIYNPSHSPGASITVTGTTGVMAKLGFATASVSATVGPGVEPVLAPLVHTLIPEVMEFGEVPNNSDTIAQQFLATSDLPLLNPIVGGKNFGTSPLLGLDGKIQKGLLPNLYDFLGVDQVVLGAKNVAGTALQGKPRVSTPFDYTAGAMLVWEGSPTQGTTVSALRTRLYKTATQLITLTNATFDGTTYTKDIVGQQATRIVSDTTGQVLYSSRDAALSGTWTEPGWVTGIALNSAPTGGKGYANLGTPVTDTAASALVPRIEVDAQNTLATLVFQSLDATTTGTASRIYVQPVGGGGTQFIQTVNAFMDNTGAWNKDVIGIASVMTWIDDNGTFNIAFEQAGNNSPWLSWDVYPFYVYASTSVPTGGTTVSASPLKAPSVRVGHNAPIVDVPASGTPTLVCADGYDVFPIRLNNVGATTFVHINKIDLTSLALNVGDKIQVIIYHHTAHADLGTWGTNVYFPDPFDGVLSNEIGCIDHFTFVNLGTNSSEPNRRLLGSVVRYGALQGANF